MSYGTTELPYTAARIKGIIKATGQITVKPAGLAGIQLDCNGATGDFTASITPANLTGNRRWILPNRDDTFAGLGAQTFAGAQTFSQDVTVDKTGGNSQFWIKVDDANQAGFAFYNRSVSGLLLYRPAGVTSLNVFSTVASADVFSISNSLLSAGSVRVLYSAVSTSPTTGALVVTGGVGIGGALNVGGVSTFAGAQTISGAFPGFNVLLITNSSSTGYGPAVQAGNGASLYCQRWDSYNGVLLMKLNGDGSLVIGTDPGGAEALRVGGALAVNSATLIKTYTTLTDGAAAAVGTLTNAPTAGNPTKWVLINDNGVIRKFPTWT